MFELLFLLWIQIAAVHGVTTTQQPQQPGSTIPTSTTFKPVGKVGSGGWGND